MTMTILALIAFALLWLVALAGVVLPILPGVPLAALGALLAAWMTGFAPLGWGDVALVAGLAGLSLLIDAGASWLGARVYGAGRAGLWGGVLGSLAGLLWFPPFGFLLGALLGAVAGEMLTGRELGEAVRAGIGALLGTLGGVLAKVLVLIAMALVVVPELARALGGG